MPINHRKSMSGKHMFSSKEDYQVLTLEGNQYLISYHEFASIKNTKMNIYRIYSGFGPFVRKDLLASFQYNNDAPFDEKDSRKLKNSLENKAKGLPGFALMDGMEKIGLTIARALEINEYATIDIMKSFDQASWDAKAEALIALNDMYQQNQQRNEIESIYPEDSIMQTKLKALEAYNDIMNELPSGTTV